MPLNQNNPLDISKPAIEILMDKINSLNLTTLDSDDFLFSTPVEETIPYATYNTKVVITPKATSGFYNKRDIFYKRMDIAQIINNRDVIITVTTETMLSELIPQINSGYGINLTADDYADTAIPAAVPGEQHSVIINITTGSYLFVGIVELLLGERLAQIDDSGYVRNYFIVTDSEEPAVYENKLIVLDSDFEVSSSLVPFRNASTVDKFRIDKLILLSNNDIFLSGEFEFSAAVGLDPLTAIVCTSVILSPSGLIKSYSDTPLFGLDTIENYNTNPLVDDVYVIDATGIMGINTNNLYKYTNDGLRDATYNAAGLAYTPTIVRLCDDGKLYTVSQQYIAPLISDPLTNAKHIRIDRLNIDGTLDSGFSTVYIRSTGIDDVTPVLDLIPVSSSGFIAVLKPIHSVATSGPSPIVNDVSFVSGSDPVDCSFNPIFKINQDGTLNTNFINLMPNNDPSSVFLDSAVFEEDNRILSYSKNKTTLLTNRINPISGYTHRAPVSFTGEGKFINIAPSKLASDIRWIRTEKLIRLATGKFIVFGEGYSRLPAGGWSSGSALAAMYNEDSQLEYVFYKPVVAGISTPLIYNLEVREILI